MTDTNPLLDFSGLPRFDAILPAHVRPAITALLGENRALIDRLADDASRRAAQPFVARRQKPDVWAAK